MGDGPKKKLKYARYGQGPALCRDYVVEGLGGPERLAYTDIEEVASAGLDLVPAKRCGTLDRPTRRLAVSIGDADAEPD